MSTFLELCTQLARRSGVIGTAPSAVTSQTGRQLKCVNWIIEAWRQIQNANPYWNFLRAEWSATLTPSTMTYTAVALGIASRFGSWEGDRDGYQPTTIYDTTIGQSDETPLRQISYEQWKISYDRGTHTATRPIHYCIAPDRSMRFGPKPDLATYIVRGGYRKSAQILAANDDEPEAPSHLHDIIINRAIMLIAEDDEAPQSLATATGEYRAMMYDMQRDCLPAFNTSTEPIG